jgi:hypothetical protein
MPGNSQVNAETAMLSESTPDHTHRYSRRRFMNCSLLAGGLGLSMADLFRLRAETSG